MKARVEALESEVNLVANFDFFSGAQANRSARRRRRGGDEAAENCDEWQGRGGGRGESIYVTWIMIQC